MRASQTPSSCDKRVAKRVDRLCTRVRGSHFLRKNIQELACTNR